jgi:hypothetical protein
MILYRFFYLKIYQKTEDTFYRPLMIVLKLSIAQKWSGIYEL